MPLSLPPSTSGRSAEQVAREVAHRAGAAIRAAFRGALSVSTKGPGNLVTDVDVRVERLAREILLGEYPRFGFLGEESPAVEGSEPFTWVVDPVDGTSNFVGGIPHLCTTLALVQEGVPVLGLTYDPLRDDLFMASAVEGATLNGQPIRVGARRTLSEATLGLDIVSDDAVVERSLEIVRALWPLRRFRVMGSGALGFAYLAAGWFDVYVHLALEPWDVAAGLLLVWEAGGDVVDTRGSPATLQSGQFIVANPHLLKVVLERTATV